MSKLTEIDASVKRILSEEVTGVLQNDIQRILSSTGRLREEVRKENGTQDPLCSQDWRHYGSSCYYLSKFVEQWMEAKIDCEHKNSHLVVINSAEEQAFVGEMTLQIRTWIGLTDWSGNWKWVDGTPYDSSPKFWGEDQPDYEVLGDKFCAEMINIGDRYPWVDMDCSSLSQYICEKKI